MDDLEKKIEEATHQFRPSYDLDTSHARRLLEFISDLHERIARLEQRVQSLENTHHQDLSVKMNDPPKCLTCWWWGLRDSASVVEVNRRCHRFPSVATRGEDGVETHWPWTNQHDYCGEHKIASNLLDRGV